MPRCFFTSFLYNAQRRITGLLIMATITVDRMQELVEDIIYGTLPHEMKLSMLDIVEPIIEREYNLGNTAVKPVSKMSLSDIWPI